jgi:hypothetical protein
MELAIRMKPPLSLALALLSMLVGGTAPADRLLEFAARERSEGPVRIAEVTGGGRVLIRLRSKSGSVLDRAQKAAEALQAASLASFARPTPTSGAGVGGAWLLKADSLVVVTADKETAQLSSTTPAALAASWQGTLKAVLEEPYLTLGERDGLQVPVEEARYVTFGGPLGTALSASSADEAVALTKVEAAARRLKVYGVQPGDTVVALTANALQLNLATQVRFWAAKIPTSAVAQLTGSGLDETVARKVAVNAALAGVTPQPAASVSVVSTDREGQVFHVAVLASGEGYFDAKKQVDVGLEWVAPPTAEPTDLFVSNSPERIYAPGGLMREQLLPDRGARFLYHHVNSTQQPILFVARIANPASTPAAVHVIVGESGPGKDELGVGHAAAVRFWEDRRTGSGYVLQIPPQTASDIVRMPVGREGIVSGLARITVLVGSPLFLEAIAAPVYHESEWVEPLAAEDYASPKLTSFRFAARKVVELSHEVGGAWTFYSLGADGSTNEAGTHLAGDYGVLHEIDLEITNPHDKPGWAVLDVRASAGLMRGLFLIDGVLHETNALVGTQQERLFREDIPPGGTRHVHIETIPESASNYPVHLVVHSQLLD